MKIITLNMLITENDLLKNESPEAKECVRISKVLDGLPETTNQEELKPTLRGYLAALNRLIDSKKTTAEIAALLELKITEVMSVFTSLGITASSAIAIPSVRRVHSLNRSAGSDAVIAEFMRKRTSSASMPTLPQSEDTAPTPEPDAAAPKPPERSSSLSPRSSFLIDRNAREARANTFEPGTSPSPRKAWQR